MTGVVLAAALILALSIAAGTALVFFTTSGTWLILLGAAVFAWMTGWSYFGAKTLIVLAFLYVFGEVMEWAGSVLGAKGFGASTAAAWGAFAGGMAGAVLGALFFGVGIFLGSLLGVVAGAFSVELSRTGDVRRALASGLGSLVGRVGVVVCKLIIALIMTAVILAAVFSGARSP